MTVDSGEGGVLNIAHSSNIFYRWPRITILHTSGYSSYAELAEKNSFAPDKYPEMVLEELLARPEAVSEILALPRGVYLFGHNHIQLHLEYEGRIFINPGSCGFTCDCGTDASYSLIEYSGGQWNVDERKVKYDVESAADGLRRSTLGEYSMIWLSVITRQLVTGRDSFSPLLRRLRAANEKCGETGFPVSNKVWRIATEGFLEENKEFL
jgi:predicted phosphodiesterase